MILSPVGTSSGILPQRRRTGLSGRRQSLGHNLLDRLVEWWPLSEQSGLRRGIHSGLDLTDNNSVTGADGVGSLASQFTAANSEYLDRASSSEVQVADIDFEFCCWVFADSFPAFNYIFAKRNAPTVREYFLDYQVATSRFRWGVSADGTNNVTVIANNLGAPSLSTWYMINAWHDAASNVIGIAANAGTADTAAHSTGVITGAGNFTVGAGDNTPTIFWNGRVQRMGFWKRLLTANERTFLYNGGRGRDYPWAA